MRATRLLLPLAVVTLAVAPVRAQTDTTAARPTAGVSGTSDRVATVPLPNGSGVFYYRSGRPGGVRIRSRAGRPAPTERGLRADDLRSALGDVEPGTREALRSGEPVTRLDLLRLELALRRALDDKLDGLRLQPYAADRDRVYRDGSGRPVVVVPGQGVTTLPQGFAPTQGTPAPTGQPSTPPRVEVPRSELAPVAPGAVTATEVERALLDAGLFRAVEVHFEFDEATLLPTAERALDTIGGVLVRYPSLEVGIGGHTDSIGSDAYNLQLSQARAAAVRAYLLVRFPGIAPERLAARGFGEAEPIATNANPTGRTLNRRVEFVVLNPEEVPTVEPEPVEDRLRRLIQEELREAREGDDG